MEEINSWAVKCRTHRKAVVYSIFHRKRVQRHRCWLFEYFRYSVSVRVSRIQFSLKAKLLLEPKEPAKYLMQIDIWTVSACWSPSYSSGSGHTLSNTSCWSSFPLTGFLFTAPLIPKKHTFNSSTSGFTSLQRRAFTSPFLTRLPRWAELSCGFILLHDSSLILLNEEAYIVQISGPGWDLELPGWT